MTAEFGKWLEEIKNSPDKEVEVDIAAAFNKIFSKNIIQIACGGEDISDDLIELELPVTKGSNQYVKKMCTIT